MKDKSRKKDRARSLSLPSGWSKRITDDGEIYFVNHIDQTTHWEDPRQPPAKKSKRARKSGSRARKSGKGSKQKRAKASPKPQPSVSSSPPASRDRHIRNRLLSRDSSPGGRRSTSPLRIAAGPAQPRSPAPHWPRRPSPPHRTVSPHTSRRHPSTEGSSEGPASSRWSPSRRSPSIRRRSRRRTRTPRRSPSPPAPRRAAAQRCSPRAVARAAARYDGLALHPYVQAQLDDLCKNRRLHRSDLDEALIMDLGEFPPADAAIIVEAFSRVDQLEVMKDRAELLQDLMRRHRDGRLEGVRELTNSVKRGQKVQFLTPEVQRLLDGLFRQGRVERQDLDQAVLETLAELEPPLALEIAENFAAQDFSKVVNKPAFLMGIIRRAKTGKGQGGGRPPSPDRAPDRGAEGPTRAREDEPEDEKVKPTLHGAVQAQLDRLFRSGVVERTEFDQDIVEMLAALPPAAGADLVREFRSQDFHNISSRTGFFVGMMKRKKKEGFGRADLEPPAPETGTLAPEVQGWLDRHFQTGLLRREEVAQDFIERLAKFDAKVAVGLLRQVALRNREAMKNPVKFLLLAMKRWENHSHLQALARPPAPSLNEPEHIRHLRMRLQGLLDRFHGKLRDRIPLELEEDPEETECVWQLEQWEKQHRQHERSATPPLPGKDRRPQGDDGAWVLVTGLPTSFTQAGIQDMLSNYGEVEKVAVAERDGQLDARIRYICRAACERAIQALDGKRAIDGGRDPLRVRHIDG